MHDPLPELRSPSQFDGRARAAVLVAGGGPAGLMAAEHLARAGCAVTLVERMPSVGRKLLMAGRTGLNLTNAEDLAALIARYGDAAPALTPILRHFPPDAAIAWAENLGQPCFIGTSRHVFPTAMKTSPLLRAWLARLQGLGVSIRTRTRWEGWDGTHAELRSPDGCERVRADAVVLALGGASWPRLGSDGAWTKRFPAGDCAPLRAANCGAIPDWPTARLAEFAGTPLRGVALSCNDKRQRGDLMIGAHWIEGGPLYHLIPMIRARLDRDARCTVMLDLRPDLSPGAIEARLARTRPRESRANRLRKGLGLDRLGRALVADAAADGGNAALGQAVKAIPIDIVACAPLDRAISSAGGLRLDGLTRDLMLRARPGLFACGEMLDWEAPTGGYLLQACLATGVAAAAGALAWLARGNRLPSAQRDGTPNAS